VDHDCIFAYGGNTAKWLQMYKMKYGLGRWPTFVTDMEEKFGFYDYRSSIHELLQLKQEGSAEEYTTAFQSMQFHVVMYNPGFDELFFTAHFVNGLKRSSL
jgi:hypothetical protein